MNELSIHLKNLLSKYECVIVPGLGGFVTYFENAHWENNTLIPPMQQVRFNQNLTYHDGLLAEMYMKYYNINYTSALERITADVQEITNSLNIHNTYLLSEIGILIKDTNNNILLKSNSAVYLPSNIGLAPITLRKLKAIESKPLYPTHSIDNDEIILRIPRRSTQIARYAAMIVLIFIITTLLPVELNRYNYTASVIPKNYPEKTSVNREYFTEYDYFHKFHNGFMPDTSKECQEEHIVTDSTIADSSETIQLSLQSESNQESNTINQTPKEESSPVKSSDNRYHLIIASLASDAQAEEYIAKQKDYNIDELTVIECNGKYRISAKSFKTYKEALHHLDSIKNTTNKSVWILCK